MLRTTRGIDPHSLVDVLLASDRLHPWALGVGRWAFRALGVGRWVLGDFFLQLRGGEVLDPDETCDSRLAASIQTAR